MFSGKKKKIQVKSVEEYLKSSDPKDTANSEDRPLSSEAFINMKKPIKSSPNVKPFIIPAIVFIIILAMVMTALSQISSIKTEVAELQQHKDGESQVLKTQIADISIKLDKSTKKVEDLTDRLTLLEKELEAQKVQKHVAETAVRKPIPTSKKKDAKPRR